VQVFNTDCVIDEVAIEMECIWDGSQKFQLAIRPFPRLPVGEYYHPPPPIMWYPPPPSSTSIPTFPQSSVAEGVAGMSASAACRKQTGSSSAHSYPLTVLQ